VTDDLVRLADQFVPLIGADPLKDVVAGLDDPCRIGAREEEFVNLERRFRRWRRGRLDRQPGVKRK